MKKELFGRNKKRKKLKNISRSRVYISCDSRDLNKAAFFKHQRKTSKLDFVDYSIKKPVLFFWRRKADYLVGKSDHFIVLLGKNTRAKKGVAKEIALARKHRKKIIGVPISKKYSVPSQFRDAGGKIVKWNCSKIQSIISRKNN